MKKSLRTVLGIAVAATLGIAIGSSVASASSWGAGPTEISGSGANPAGISVPIAFGKNAHGETFGSVLSAKSPDQEPDLILVQLADQRTGYVKRADLRASDGSDAASPQAAIAFQTQRNAAIPAYSEDGVTVIGSFSPLGG